ncbi:hypothetical protein [Amycolatopsis sp. PS_44_ISF1]|uniref:hypothetical protein n=1 Tax=Amycolatopsis sp. PS_44_ISF1 TaxID=2974917 RepID=UPI0028EF0A42|nr:hypothetical protein [Amycolatopsis sp. PS_44_ISF1]
MSTIARHAGVGVATLYRRFPTPSAAASPRHSSPLFRTRSSSTASAAGPRKASPSSCGAPRLRVGCARTSTPAT